MPRLRSRRAAAAAAAAAATAAAPVQEEVDLVRRTRFVIQVESDFFVVPFDSRKSVRELAAELQARIAHRYNGRQVLELQIRTEMGVGLLADDDVLEDVVAQADSLVATVGPVGPIRRRTELVSAHDQLAHMNVRPTLSERRETNERAAKSPDAHRTPQPAQPEQSAARAAQPWASSVVTMHASVVPSEPAGSAAQETQPARRLGAERSADRERDSSERRRIGEGTRRGLNEEASKREFFRELLKTVHPKEDIPDWKLGLIDQVQAHLSVNRIQKQQQQTRRTSGSQMRSRAGITLPDIGNSRASSAPSEGGNVTAHEVEHMKQTAKAQERRLYYYKNAMNNLELERQMQEEREQVLRVEIGELEKAAGLHGDDEMRRIRKAQEEEITLQKLSQKVGTYETRVSEAHIVNSSLKDIINGLRKQRVTLSRQLHVAKTRSDAMTADIRHFAAYAHTTLDESSKWSSRLERLRHEYGIEKRWYSSKIREVLEQAQVLDVKLHDNADTFESNTQDANLARYRRLRETRDASNKRESRFGYLRDTHRFLEEHFKQILTHVDAGNDLSPESVKQILEFFSKRNEHSASLMNALNHNEQVIMELERDVRGLKQTATQLDEMREQQAEYDATDFGETFSIQPLDPVQEIHDAISALSPVLTRVVSEIDCELDPEIAEQGCHPGTALAYLHAIDVKVHHLQVEAHRMLAHFNEKKEKLLLEDEFASITPPDPARHAVLTALTSAMRLPQAGDVRDAFKDLNASKNAVLQTEEGRLLKQTLQSKLDDRGIPPERSSTDVT